MSATFASHVDDGTATPLAPSSSSPPPPPPLRLSSPLLLPPYRPSSDPSRTTTASPAAAAAASTTTTTTTAMIILNTPIARPPSALFEHLWKVSQFHICADGGANRLYTATTTMSAVEEGPVDASTMSASTMSASSTCYLPDVIRGDLDSLLDHVREYYASHKVIIEHDPDQNTNDLDKAMQKIVSLRTTNPPNEEMVLRHQDQDDDDMTSSMMPPLSCGQVIIYGGFGGRFDQEMASFQALYRWANVFDNRIWLYSDETSAVLIPGNDRLVELVVPYRRRRRRRRHGDDDDDDDADDTSRTIRIQEGPTCGLIPLGAKCDSLTTTGFQWNLHKDETEFGGLVSTSNRIVGNKDDENENGNENDNDPDDRRDDGVVTVRASHPIIFTAEITLFHRSEESNSMTK